MTTHIDATVMGNPVRLVSGDLTEVEADGVVIPHFRGAASFAGVGGAVARGGAMMGMRLYQAYLEQAFPPPGFGSVIVTRSGGGTAWWLLHATSVGGGAEHDADVARRAVRNALGLARARGVTSLAVPALATGMAGSLSARDAASAMLSGVADHVAAGGLHVPVRIVTHHDPAGHADFADVLASGAYDAGGRPDDDALLTAMTGLQRDVEAFAETFEFHPGPAHDDD